eukprot:s3243_g5.t1
MCCRCFVFCFFAPHMLLWLQDMELAENSSGRWARNVWEATKSISCCGHWGRALGFLEAFVASRLRLNHVSVNACINVARRGSGWHVAELLFDQFPRRSLVPDISSFGVLTSAYALSKQWWKALHSLLLSPSDKLSFNALCSSLRWLWALCSLEMMSSQQIRRDTTNQNCAISACEKSGIWKNALQSLAQLPEDALIPDVITYNASISACQKAYHGWRYSSVLLDRCPQPELLSFNGSLAGGDWMHGLQLVQEMRSRQVQPDSFSLSTLIDSCGHEWPVALALSQRFQGLQNRVSLNAAITACTLGIQWERALWLLFSKSDKTPDLIAFSSAITACQRVSKWRQAMYLFTSLSHINISPDAICFYGALSSCANVHKWQSTLNLLEHMTLKRLPHSISHAAAAVACEQSGQWQIVLKNFSCVSTDVQDVIGWNAVANASQNGQQWNLAVKTQDLIGRLALRDVELLLKMIWNTLCCAAALCRYCLLASHSLYIELLKSHKWVQTSSAHTKEEVVAVTMPLVTVFTDVDGLVAKKQEVCQMVHEAVKSALGKPDQYITVALMKAECVTVAGQEASVVVEVDSIGGDFGSLISTIAKGLQAHGVEPSKVTGTFRGVSFKEFAMNGRPLG